MEVKSAGLTKGLDVRMNEERRGINVESNMMLCTEKKVGLGNDKGKFYLGHIKLEIPNLFNGEGNVTPLQYSCLENPMDGGAW